MALKSGTEQVGALSYPFYPKAAKLGMRELVKIADLGVEDINGTVITTRSFIAQQRDTVLRFMRAFACGMRRYQIDKDFSKRVLGKYARSPRMRFWKGPGKTTPQHHKNPRVRR